MSDENEKKDLVGSTEIEEENDANEENKNDGANGVQQKDNDEIEVKDGEASEKKEVDETEKKEIDETGKQEIVETEKKKIDETEKKKIDETKKKKIDEPKKKDEPAEKKDRKKDKIDKMDTSHKTDVSGKEDTKKKSQEKTEISKKETASKGKDSTEKTDTEVLGKKERRRESVIYKKDHDDKPPEEKIIDDSGDTEVESVSGEMPYYDKSSLITPPSRSAYFPLKRIPLSLHYSYGYDCHRRGNIQVFDSKTLVFASGNFVHFFDIETKEKTYLRSIGGCGIGHIALHPNARFLVIAEKGINPNIYIYECKSLEICKVLREGASSGYAFVSFNPSGKLLASVATDPDYTLTIWDWKLELIILKTRAFFNDVYVVAFSPFTPGFLSTGGLAHIKFWKMAKTFTGLKLQGETGRFGRTETSNIEGLTQFPDGKVLSGSEWGNLLLWDAGLIKVELSRRGGKTCHSSAVAQFVLEEGDILSVGHDGNIRVWQFEVLDSADSIVDKGIFEVEPQNELHVGFNVDLMYIVKSLNPEASSTWFAQDRNGAIWSLDLSFSYTSKQPEKIHYFHSGAIKGMDVSPISHLVATGGVDGTVKLLDILSKQTLAEKKFFSGATAITWFPKEMQPTGNLIAVGFADGVLRILSIEPGVSVLNEPIVELQVKICRKPHSDQITGISFYPDQKLILTGSIDCTVFLCYWGNDLQPVGFVSMPAAVTSVSCSPPKFNPKSVLVTCSNGEMARFNIPEVNKKLLSSVAKKKTFSMDSDWKTYKMRFTSIKSRLKYTERLLVMKKMKEERAKKQRLREDTRSYIETPVTSDEEEELLDDQDLFVPTEPSAILFGFCTPKQLRFWLSMDNFDAGYLYEYDIVLIPNDNVDEEEKYAFTETAINSFPLPFSDDSPVLSYAFSNDGLFVVFGFKNGLILLFKLSNPFILTSASYHWCDRFHDCDTGAIYNLCFSYDQKFVISSGADGNVFVYKFEALSEVTGDFPPHAAIPEQSMTKEEIAAVVDITDQDYRSLEEEKRQFEHSKLMKLVDAKKYSLQQQIRFLQVDFMKINEINKSLPKQMQLNRRHLVVSDTLRKELMSELNHNEDQTVAELAWEAEKSILSLEKMQKRFKDDVKSEILKVKGINSTLIISSYRLAYLDSEVEKAMRETEDQTRTRHRFSQRDDVIAREGKTPRIESTPVGMEEFRLSTVFSHLDRHVQRVLKRIEEKKRKRSLREAEWEALRASKPNTSKGNPILLKNIDDAKNNLGDYSLKSSSDYAQGSGHMRMTTKKKIKQLMTSLHRTFQYKEEFNRKIYKLRDRKQVIVKRIEWISQRMTTIQKTMQLGERLKIPSVPVMEPYEIPEEILKTALEKLNTNTESSLQPERTTSRMPGMGKYRVSVISALSPGGRQPKLSTFPRGSPGPPTSSTVPWVEPEVKSSAVLMHNSLKAKLPASELEIRMQQLTLVKNLHEQSELVEEVNDLIRVFDQELTLLVEEKHRLDVAIKQGELRQLVLFEESQLLAQFETEEEALLTKINQRTEEELELKEKIQDLQDAIDAKKREFDRFHEQEKMLLIDLQVMLGEHNKFGIFLTKVYKKRVKRPKKREPGEEEEEESSESEEDSDFSGDDDEDDEYINDKECPDGCDCQLFESVLKLREKRLDIEELIVEGRRYTEMLKKEIDGLNKKLKNVEAILKALHSDFKKVEQEKQGQLNELVTTVPLKLNQVQYLVDGELPNDLKQCLIFPAARLRQLENRIQELQQEKVLHRRRQKQSKIHLTHLEKECTILDNKIGQLQTKCNELMMEKFGCIVDLDKLESQAVNRGVEEMKDKVKKLGTKFDKEQNLWKKKADKFEAELSAELLSNTSRLLGLNDLFLELQEMESLFATRLKNLPHDLMPEQTMREVEENKLQNLIQCQEREIVALKEKLRSAREKAYCPYDDINEFIRKQNKLICPRVKSPPKENEELEESVEEEELVKKCIQELLENEMRDFDEFSTESDWSTVDEVLSLHLSTSDTRQTMSDTKQTPSDTKETPSDTKQTPSESKYKPSEIKPEIKPKIKPKMKQTSRAFSISSLGAVKIPQNGSVLDIISLADEAREARETDDVEKTGSTSGSESDD